MPFFAAVAHRGKNFFNAGLINEAFETEEAAHLAAVNLAAVNNVDGREDVETTIAVFPADDIQAARIEAIRRGLDWRWQPPEKGWLQGRTLRHHRYRTWSPTWDHDHCQFCWRKFMDPTDPQNKAEWFADAELATVGYATTAFDNKPNDYHWICESCFREFHPFFHWNAIEGEEETRD